ncbi:phosphatidyl inositol kinase [Scheffersomyces coipomensis]|uniref:phosphatidyl inositol kinase n=1 Tax=Scheffersomyces coipomensis TaxID=1788519 RepID=UPI00315D42C7
MAPISGADKLKVFESRDILRERSVSPNTPFEDSKAQQLKIAKNTISNRTDEVGYDDQDEEDIDNDDHGHDEEEHNGNSTTPVLSHSWAPSSTLKSPHFPSKPKFFKSSSIAVPLGVPNDDHTRLTRTRSNPQISVEEIGNIKNFTKNYIIPAAKWAYSPISTSKSKGSGRNAKHKYKIEYSVFKPLKHLRPIKSEKDFIIHWRKIVEDETNEHFDFPSNFITQAGFADIINGVTKLIEIENIFPERIAAGSSGSYFVYNRNFKNREILERAGVFKPKDEEPYGPVSPKWTKWAHRTFFPCCFGRSCLIPNLGYISEAAATVIDQQLLSYIVPHTEVIQLRSPTFYYSYFDKSDTISKLPQKVGSFQMFLKGYNEAINWLRLYPIPNDINGLPENLEVEIGEDEIIQDTQFKWSKKSIAQFREEVEKLVILDYIIRNTDRSLDNWMIKINWKLVKDTKPKLNQNGKKTKKYIPIIKIGAIDNGLAFPWKQPDQWRSFPFGWLFLPLSIIGQPFSLKTRHHYLPLLTSKFWWEQTVSKLKEVFEKDNDFKTRLWLKQLAVLKGQAFNVVEILKLSYAGPLELSRRENLEVIDDITSIPRSVCNDKMLREMQSSVYDLEGFNTGYSPYNPKIDEDEEEEDEDEEDADEEETVGGVSSGSTMNDTTPLLLAGSPDIKSKSKGYVEEDDITGFEYNLHHPTPMESSHDESNLNDVVIERIVKANGNPPVFTWC